MVGQKRKQGSVSGKSYKTTSPNQPAGSSHSIPPLVYSNKDVEDHASVHTSSSKKSKKTTASERQRKADEGYDEWLADQIPDDPDMLKKPPSPPPSVCGSAEDRKNRSSILKCRPKFDKCS